MVLNKVQELPQKKFFLQFLPLKLEEVSKAKYIYFNGKKLKSAYIIDIVHTLLLKYYFKNENKFILNAVILKEKYGFLYNYYILYLVHINILVMSKNYLVGKSSREYSLINVINSKISRYQNDDKVLLKKYHERYYSIEMDQNVLINKHIKEKLVNDLYSVRIDDERSSAYLNMIKYNNTDIYNRNLYSVDAISNKHIFYHFDNYGRLHTNFTILKSFIRKNCILIDNEEVFEIDIPNSQPLFLSKLITDSESRWVNEEELDFFKKLLHLGRFYDYIMLKMGLGNKKEAKQIVYKILFGKNYKSKYENMFSNLFPSIYTFIKLYKKEHNNYKVLAYTLQKMESELIFNQIINTIITIDPDVKIITIHDSIITQKSKKELVERIFNQKVKQNFNI